MPDERLSIEFNAEDGWVTLRRPQGASSERAQAMFQVREGFTLADVVDAVRSTGWIVERAGELSIDQDTSCQTLADAIVEMTAYFDAPQVPSKELLRIKQEVDAWLAEDLDPTTSLSLWVYAWLDVVIRKDAAEDVLTTTDIWRTDVLDVDLGQHRDRRLRQLLERCQESPAREPTSRMAPSQRSRRAPEQQEREVG
jgi:hypothetical protein